MSNKEETKTTNFIRQIIDKDLVAGKNKGRVATRFPPEPNGFLHIGHAKSIVLNFGIAVDYAGTCNLRYDDTNPHKENIKFVESIAEDVRWLGYDWNDRQYFASDYFTKLYNAAVDLIKLKKAYVCDLSPDEVREYRGTLTTPGKNSPYRERTVAENLDLFGRMKEGEFNDGSRVLRAKIDMSSPNINLRDPTIYRIRTGVIHHQTGEAWCIYPMYDFTHCLSDSFEKITHSLCTLEFADHRPLYNWFLDTLKLSDKPQQIEFSRLTLEHTITSKRKLTELVTGGFVNGWDDPRLPTIAGLRRRGYTSASILEFCRRIGVTKADNIVEMSVLEDCIRTDLNANAPRRMAVLNPLKVILTNYEENKIAEFAAPNHPQNEALGSRLIPFGKTLYIDNNDFYEIPPKKFKRLVPGGEVRLRNAYVIRCDQVIKDSSGKILELRCSIDPDTLGKNPEGRKVKGVIQWVEAASAQNAEVRLYDRLFTHPTPDSGKEGVDYKLHINQDSLIILKNCLIEKSIKDSITGDQYQFEREGYFCVDDESTKANLIFNQTVSLRDTWAKSK